MMAPEPHPSSRTITFYSYKGGTGRSMALANIAWTLACSGRQVLVIDWDLEAPGLHRYFAPFLADPHLAETRGIIDFVWELATEAGTEAHGEDDPEWYVPLADFRRVAVSLEYDFPAGGGIDFVPAGCQNSVYSERVTTFDWRKFYEHSGGVFLEAARQKAQQNYDYILIDSRTGVSDASGICTVQMPDLLILCFTANNQSIKGAAGIAKYVRAQWNENAEKGYSKRRIFPLLTRVDGFERERLDRRRALARAEFASLIRGTDGLLELPYIPIYSYEETLAVFRDRPEDREAALLPGIERLTALVSDGTVTKLESPPNETQRRRTLARFEGREDSEIEIASKVLESKRYDVFVSYAATDRPAVVEIVRRLRAENLQTFYDTHELVPGERWDTQLDAALAASSSIMVFVGPSGLRPGQNREILYALDRSARSSPDEFRIVPVYLPGAEPAKLELPPMLRALQAADFRNSLDEQQTFDQLVAAIRAPASSRTKELPVANPYKGLESFRSADSKYFFARESLIEELLSTVRKSLRDVARLIWIVGGSGSGKSSLLHAGLLPWLARGTISGSGNWRNVIVRPGSDPAASLASGILSTEEGGKETWPPGSEAKIASMISTDPSTLKDVAQGIANRSETARRIVLIVDQFEEMFTIADRASREACIENLVQAASDRDGPVAVIIAIRSDYFSRCLDYPALTPSLTKHRITVGPLTGAELREAIVRPAQMVGCEFEQGLVELLLRDTEGQAEALPLLQLTLQELWEKREGRRLTVASYARMNGLPGVIAARASETLDAFDEKQRRAAQRIFLCLVNVSEDTTVTGKRVPIASLVPQGEMSKASGDVIQRLIAARLLTVQSDSADGQQFVEIAHEALIQQWEPLRIWIEASRLDLRTRTQLAAAAREWRASGELTDYLYTRARVRKVREAIVASDDLPELETVFLQRSMKHGTAILVRKILLVLCLAVLTAAVWFATPYIIENSAAKLVAEAGFAWHEGSKTLNVLPSRASSIYDLSAVAKSARFLHPEVLDLTGCSNLSDTSALSDLQTLEVLQLDDCSGLENVNGLRSLEVLRFLTLERCVNLQNLDGLKGLSQLRFIDLRGCNKLAPERLSTLKAALPHAAIRQPKGGFDLSD